jgi:tRNA-dihydrouridine synthase
VRAGSGSEGLKRIVCRAWAAADALHARSAQMFSTLTATKKVVAEADHQFDHFHAVMAKPTT